MGPIAMTILAAVIVMIALTFLSDNKGTDKASLAFTISLIGATIAGLNNDVTQITAFLVIAFITVMEWRVSFGAAIGVLYIFRVTWVGYQEHTDIPDVIWWDINNAMVVAQLIIAYRGAKKDGGLRNIKNNYRIRRDYFYDFILSPSGWVEAIEKSGRRDS